MTLKIFILLLLTAVLAGAAMLFKEQGITVIVSEIHLSTIQKNIYNFYRTILLFDWKACLVQNNYISCSLQFFIIIMCMYT